MDIVENARIAEMLEEHPSTFEQKIFTQREIDYAAQRRRRVEHFAARFAAKEAVAKALGQGMTNGVSWKDIEVIHDPAGKPHISLTGHALRLAEKMGVRSIHLSLSHSDIHSIAFVVAESA